MKNSFKLIALAGLLAASFAACTGSDDGHPSLEGSSDPANTGGKLSGDHVKDAPATDSTDVINK